MENNKNIWVTDKIQTNNNSNFPQYTDSWAVKTLYFKVYMIKSYNLLQKKKISFISQQTQWLSNHFYN